MKKPWNSKITALERDKLTTFGIDQEEIVRSFSYEQMVFLLIFGRMPSADEGDLLRAVVVAHCSHGISGQSTLAVRMAADCGSSFMNAAIGGFSVGSGPYHQGGLERAMRELEGAVAAPSLDAYVANRLTRKERIFGFGHRFHSFDPRARTLMELCSARGFVNRYVAAARRIDVILFEEKGIHMNIEAAGGAVLLDLGFPVDAAWLIIMIGRGPMLAAAYLERLRSGNNPFQKLEISDIYDD